MTSKKTDTNPNQTALIEVAAAAPDVGTRHQEMLEAAITAAEESGVIESMDGALLSIARANARALDNAESLGPKSCYAIASLTPAYREVLSTLRMTPEDRNQEANDELANALRDLATPAVRNA